MSRVFITGINGFLGAYLSDALRAVGHETDGNDNDSCSSAGYPHREIDCRNYNNMYAIFQQWKPEIVVHCAALAHEGVSNFSPSFITDSIYSASVSIFSAAIEAGVKRIIFMSSMARYGNGIYRDLYNELGIKNWRAEDNFLPFEEWHSPSPIDPYGIAKVAAEQTLMALCKLHNVEYVIAVPHNIIGPRQKYDDPFRNVASIMINRALQNKPILVYGDGQQKRCFSPISDCLDSLVKMIDAPISGEIINIGPDKGEITVLELAEIIQDLTACGAEIQHVAARPNEVKEAYCSSAKARKLLGYSEKQSLRECLAEMVLYIKEHGPKPFAYNFPIEIKNRCPDVWLNKKI